MGTLGQRVRSAFCVVLSAAALLLSSCSGGSTYTTVPLPDSQWVVAWGAPPENALASATNPGGEEQTFRSIILPTIDGSQERVRLSNLYGSAPITIGSAHLAVVTTAPAVDSSTDQPLTFNGATSVTIPAGQTVTSDSVKVFYTAGQKLAVTTYVKGTFAPLTQHQSPVMMSYATATNAGDMTKDTSGASFTNSVQRWLLVTGVDVYGPYQGTVVLLGSSSIDGTNSNYLSTNAYPAKNTVEPTQDNDTPADWLGRSLLAAGYRLGVANGGQIADPAAPDATTASGTSQAGIDRFNRDVVQQPGVKAVIVYIGGVDLRLDCKSATDVEASLTNIIAQGAAANLRVIIATIPPSEYCTTSDPSLLPSTSNPWQGDLNPGPENPGSTQRRLVNTWIRNVAATLPGVVAVADFDAALAYPAHPDFLLPNFVSGDNFHPTGLGYQAQNGAIPLKAILGN
ncbi:GDSL-type esterase/lipase family protein [Terriglobus aquaticus]|uniref:GDSL-type esterase/lipase family protein n=1 Tax=Terriglobus aquaticus TaxID=940139 RepID=A0ABW9KI55_9BACT|nr:GDSL-type esterase/lipase family protein [Terriglobus aquaticus]